MDYEEQRALDNWDPEVRPVHCSNCLHAKVYEEHEQRRGQKLVVELKVRCAKGMGKRKSLPYWSLIRLKHPTGFLQARECPEWESMDDE